MSYARSTFAVRVAVAFGVACLLVVATVTTSRAETRRVVVRVYETGTGDLAVRTAAIQTAASIVDLAGIPVEW